MANYMYRGTAFAKMVNDMLRAQYFKELPGNVAGLTTNLADLMKPTFEKMVGDYYTGAAGLGQAVPGQGLSSAAQGGLTDLMAQYMSNITGTAFGAAQQPWESLFGGTPTSMSRFQTEATKKAQQGQAFAAGTGAACCFIFTEANDGVLDRIARRYRDEYGTIYQEIGYKTFAFLVVPKMKKNRAIKAFIKWAMVKPMIWWGRAFYGENKWGHAFYPVALFWLRNFEALGRKLTRGVKKNAINTMAN